jgi:trimeric autotransporter adhesin
MGSSALYSNTSGAGNAALGHAALYFNTTGGYNLADGYAAGYNETTGSYNVAVGYAAGYNQTTGSNNIYVGNRGVAAESGVIRIGTSNTQTETYIAGIENTQITGSAVYVTSSGQLGVLASSERYKTEITPIGKRTEKLQELRPVSFHLKTDPKGTLQYGLIAEEVDKVYPELVIRDATGKIQGVRYDELAPMLLTEVQRQAGEIRDLKQQVAGLTELKQEMRAVLLKLRSKDQLVARR